MDLCSFLRIKFTIGRKASVLIAALGLMSALANWYCLKTIDRIDKANGIVVEHIAPARLALAEAKGALTAFGLAVYKMSGYADRAQIAEETNAMVGDFNAIENALSNVRGYYPETAEDIAQIVGKLATLRAVADEAHGFKVGDQPQELRFLLEYKFIAALDDTVFHLNRLINILGAVSGNAIQEVETARNGTIRVTTAIVVLGTFLMLATALALSQVSL